MYESKDGNEDFFRIERSTQLKKLVSAYCDRKSVEINSIAFLFDGRHLRGEHTLDELEMEEGDVIDAMLHQTVETCKNIGMVSQMSLQATSHTPSKSMTSTSGLLYVD
ncbi:small ubiquitin-related modifier 1-like protein [Tanacetum coccineum]